MQDPLLRKMRMLTQLIIFSAALNIGLISSLIYIVAEKKWHRQQKIEIAPVSSLTNATVIRTFFSYSYQDLLRELVDAQLVEYGYTRRDLALACLVQFHYFDIERALANTELQKRELEFIHRDGGEHVKLTVYPGLSDAHFESVKLLAAREEWPLTSEGLFYELKKNEGSLSASSLQEAFFATHEFYTLYTLCARSFEGISQEEVLTLLLEGSWNSIHSFVAKVRSVSDLSLDHLRKFLLEYVPDSQTAIGLFIQNDSDYLLKKVEDKILKDLILAIKQNDLHTTLFLKQLLCSVRGDSVRKAAATKLYELAQETMPEPYDHEACVKRFLPTLFSQTVPQVEPKNCFEKIKVVTKKHVVQEGDSLWKIARIYRVDLEALIKENGLDPDSCLQLGKELIIP